MLKWKRLMMITLSTSILMTQGVPLPYLAYAMEESRHAPVNGEVKISWTTADQVTVGSTFNPYEGLQAIDADGDNVAILTQVEGEVDTSREGVYPISYSIKNVDGQTFTMTRQVEVVASNSASDENVVDDSNEETTQTNPTEGSSSDATEEKLPNDEKSEENSSPSLNEVEWSLYDRLSKQELIKFNVDVESGQYVAQFIEDLNDLLMDLDEETLDQEILKLRILSSKQVEKFSTTLTVRDLLGETEELIPLNELPYEMGDQISLIPVVHEKTILVVNGITDGDISKEQEDYSDGVESEDLIRNVRFVIHETGLSTLYNEAPIIEGIEDTVVPNFEYFDPKDGVTVKDDHDDNLLPQLVSTIEQVDDNTQKVTYQVTDSWGRTTEAIRHVTQDPSLEQSISLTTDDEGEDEVPVVQTSITENTITVKGIEFNDAGDERFTIVFDPKQRKIYVQNQDGLTMNSRIKDTYFVLTHYSAKGEVKNRVELLGTDRSNSAKLNELKNNGWRYSEGDYISLWHAESETKLVIAGTVSGVDDSVSLTQGITADYLRTHRFELNSSGLKQVTNTAPTIKSDSQDNSLTISRGDKVDILSGLVISDDHDDIKKLDVMISEYSVTTLGTQEVTITVTDTWGESTEYKRKLIVNPKNDIDEMTINVQNKSGETVFTLGFDELTKKLTVTNQTDNSIDPGNDSDVLIIRIYSKSGKTKRTIRIKGTDLGTSSVIEAIKNYTYSKDDYISIVPTDPSIISIEGKITNQQGDVEELNETDNLDKLINARFQLKSDGTVIYNYNHAPTFSGVEPKTITRGEEFNPLDGVIVTDEEDGTIDNSNIVVKYDQAALNTIGKTTVTYTVTDSWGRTTTVEREITVVAPNNLEYYQFHLLNGEDALVSIGFDTVDDHLVVTQYMLNDYIEGNSADEVFKLTIFNSEHKEQGSITLNYEQMIDDTFVESVEKLTVEKDDYITLSSPLHNSVIVSNHQLNSVFDDVTEAGYESRELFTFDSSDELEHTRFEVSEDSLKMVYNEAPKIIGAIDTKVVYGNNFDKMNGVTVEDEEELTSQLTVTGEVNTQELGTYSLTYTVTDSYGRTATVERTVTVVPVYTTNEVQYIDENNQYLISIGINESATGFTGTITDLSTTTNTLNDENVNQDGNLDIPNEILFKFTVYDNEGNTVEVLEITEQTIIDEHLFDQLKALTVRPGYRFSVEARDLTKVKITGELEKDKQVEDINYSGLTVDNTDAIDNVRFELTENIMKAIYNEAPVIKIQPTPSESEDQPSDIVTLTENQTTDDSASEDSTLIIRNKALTKEAYNLLEGVTVEDDKDELTLTVDNVTVVDEMLCSDLDQSVQTIGKTYEVTYQVTDSWGRQSDSVKRQVQIKSAMDDISLEFLHAASGFVVDKDQKALTLTFNMNEGNIIATEGNMSKFKFNTVQYGAFGIYSKDADELSLKLIIGGSNTYEKDTEFNGSWNGNSVSGFIDQLNANNTINYGDKIKIKIYQSPFFYINGTVLNAQEDYSQGAMLGSVLNESYFVVTPEGLKQEYSVLTANENEFTEIDWYSGVAGIRSFSLQLDHSNPDSLMITAVAHDTEWISTLDYENVLTLELYSADGTKIIGDSYTGRNKPESIVKVFNNQSVTPGDYFVVRPLIDKYLSNFKLYNITEKKYFPIDIDYTGVITERTYFDDVRFYITKQGIIPVYNAGPVFVGADEIDIIVGTEFNVTDGVTVTDQIDGNISEYKFSGDGVSDDGTIDTSQVETYTITYTAIDSWGRTTEHTRIINVRPALFDNKIQVFSTTDTNNPAFEIIFDNQKVAQSSDSSRNDSSTTSQLGGLEVKIYSTQSLDLSLATQDVFKIWVLDANGKQKVNVVLQGRDAANSDKLNALKEIEYNEGDVIKVWRHPGLNSDGTGQIETLKIMGLVANDSNSKTSGDYSNGFENLDQMNNTVFTISNDGLKAYYNEAPVLNGVTNKTIYYGETFNPYEGVSVTDDRDPITLKAVQVTHDVNTNRVGEYTVTYTVTDCWGRTTSQTITVKVLSKVVNNKIEVYSNDSTKAFTIGFNEAANRLELTSDSPVISDVDYSSLEMTLIVYDRFGNKKADISITGEDSVEEVREKLTTLTQITITNNDMISVTHTDPKLIKINGEVVANSHDYQNGFNDTESMKTVRFQVTNNGLKEIQPSDYTIQIEKPYTPLVIQRGEPANLIQGVTVNHPNETIILTEDNVENFDINKLGYQIITYTVTDSWGMTATAKRLVKVEAQTDLENYNIHLMDDVLGWFKKFTIGFDTVNMKLTAKVPNFITPLFGTLPQDGTIFELNVYNQNHELQNSFELTASDLNASSEIVSKIQNESIEYGYFIEVRAYNYDKGLKFVGEITMESRDEDSEESEEEQTQKDDFNTMSKEDFITNARFEITEEGLVALYNEAPVITGVQEFEYIIGDEQDFRENLQVSDDYDELTYEDIEVTSPKFDFYELGEYEVTYSLTDTWGRTVTETSKIWILSGLEENIITLKSKDSEENHSDDVLDDSSDSNDDPNWMMKLGFDSKTKQLQVEFNDKNTAPVGIDVTLSIIQKKGTEEEDSTEQDQEEQQEGSTRATKDEVIVPISISSTDTVVELRQKFDLFNGYTYTYGNSINIDIREEETNQVTISNPTLLSDDIPEKSYQGTTETLKDYFENVRFELSEYGLQAIYNHAPKIEITEGDLILVKSRDVEDYDLLGALKIKDEDDYDSELSNETDIKVYYNKDLEGVTNPEDPDNLKLGDNTITYVGMDSWGRKSNELTRKLTLTSGMNEIEIKFGQIYDSQVSNDKLAMTLTFDMEQNTITAIKNDEAGNDKFKMNSYYSYSFQLYEKDSEQTENEEPTYNQIYGAYYGVHGWDQNIMDEILAAPKGTGTAFISTAVNNLNNANLNIEYGMLIRLRTVQSSMLFLEGPIVNAQEDYSAGAQLASILNNSYFIITPEGLEQVYEENIKLNEKENIITWYSGVAGEKQVEIKINPDTQKFTVDIFNEKEPMDTLYKKENIFTITQYSANGSKKKTTTYTGAQYPTDVQTDWNDCPFEIGDYLEIELVERRQVNMRIYGKIKQGEGYSTIDYSNEIPDIAYYNESRFYITAEGLSLDYNEAPIFSGIEDVTLFKDEEFNLRAGITVEDDNTNNITYKVTTQTDITSVNYDDIEEIEDVFNTSNIGAYQVNYVAKDDRGRITVEPRFIWVYARSEITVPADKQHMLIIQEADPNLRTEEAVYKYLIDMVLVTDEEDDDAAGGEGLGITVTKDNIETNLNPMVPGVYPVKYTVTDSDGNVSEKTFDVTVVRSINVSVPRNDIPFQVVTNLLGEDTEGKEFISGTIKIQNNYVTDVNVSIKSLTVNADSEQSSTRNGTFTLVEPNSVEWETLSEEDTMTKMALGLYVKSGITGKIPVEESPIWLMTDMSSQLIGTLPGRENDPLSSVTEAVLSFTAKYGTNFTSGKHRMKFTMVLEFD